MKVTSWLRRYDYDADWDQSKDLDMAFGFDWVGVMFNLDWSIYGEGLSIDGEETRMSQKGTLLQFARSNCALINVVTDTQIAYIA